MSFSLGCFSSRRSQTREALPHRYRFYGSSLLFVREGSPAPADAGPRAHAGSGSPPPTVDVRMIDFAHVARTVPPDGNTGGAQGAASHAASSSGRDAGYALGLASIIACLEWVQREEEASKDALPGPQGS